MKRLENRPAIVTGAGSGIGRASAIRKAAEGAKVLLIGRTEATLRETCDAIRAAGDTADIFVADAADETQMLAALDECVSLYGGLAIFFANAGNTDTVTAFLDQTVEAWEGRLRRRHGGRGRFPRQ